MPKARPRCRTNPVAHGGQGWRDEPHPIANGDEKEESHEHPQRVGGAEEHPAQPEERDAKQHDGARTHTVHQVTLKWSKDGSLQRRQAQRQ